MFLTESVEYRKISWRCPAIAAILFLTGTSISTAAMFTGLGAPFTQAYGVNGNGSVVTGLRLFPGGTSPVYAFRWTSTTGLQNMGALGGNFPSSEGYGVSADGSHIVGFTTTSQGTRAFRTNGLVMQSLGVFPGWSSSFATAISADSNTVVGRGQNGENRAFRWTSAGGMESLGALPGHFGVSIATGVSGNGSEIVGISGGSGTARRAFQWSSAGMSELSLLPNAYDSDANAISSDGTTIVGTIRFAPSSNSVAVRWTRSGIVEQLGTLDAGARATNANGTLVVGDSSSGPFLWSNVLGMANLNTYLPSLGVNLTGWMLTNATGISADGSTIIGLGSHNGAPEAWVATIPEPTSLWLFFGIGAILVHRRGRYSRFS
jgi:uncharacterized membrane protein